MGRKKGKKTKFGNKKDVLRYFREIWEKKGILAKKRKFGFIVGDFILKGKKEDCRTFGIVQNQYSEILK
jgi:hypothetical protein